MPDYIPRKDKIHKGSHIDFEGFGRNKYSAHPRPVLIGMLRGGFFKQVVFTQDYKWAAKDSGVEHDVEFFPNRNEFLLQILEETSPRNKPLFAYSVHEEKLLNKLLTKHVEDSNGKAKKFSNPELDRAKARIIKKIGDRYRNVKRLAEAEINRRRSRSSAALPDVPEEIPNTLEGLAEALGISMQHKLPRGGVTSRLRQVKEYSKSQKAWEKAPKKVRKAWIEVLKHNKEDVCILPKILLKLKE